MTDIVLKDLTEEEYTGLRVAYAESKHKHWKDFIIEIVKIWKQKK